MSQRSPPFGSVQNCSEHLSHHTDIAYSTKHPFLSLRSVPAQRPGRLTAFEGANRVCACFGGFCPAEARAGHGSHRSTRRSRRARAPDTGAALARARTRAGMPSRALLWAIRPHEIGLMLLRTRTAACGAPCAAATSAARPAHGLAMQRMGGSCHEAGLKARQYAQPCINGWCREAHTCDTVWLAVCGGSAAQCRTQGDSRQGDRPRSTPLLHPSAHPPQASARSLD